MRFIRRKRAPWVVPTGFDRRVSRPRCARPGCLGAAAPRLGLRPRTESRDPSTSPWPRCARPRLLGWRRSAAARTRSSPLGPRPSRGAAMTRVDVVERSAATDSRSGPPVRGHSQPRRRRHPAGRRRPGSRSVSRDDRHACRFEQPPIDRPDSTGGARFRRMNHNSFARLMAAGLIPALPAEHPTHHRALFRAVWSRAERGALHRAGWPGLPNARALRSDRRMALVGRQSSFDR
jgi:hypothetical protein